MKTTMDMVDTLGRTLERGSELFIKNVNKCTFTVRRNKLNVQSTILSYQCSIDVSGENGYFGCLNKRVKNQWK